MTRKIYTYDCETDPFKHGRIPKPFLWGVYSEQPAFYREFEDTDKFVAWMKNQDALFFAHNGGKFDNFFLAKHINKNEKVLMINGRLVQCKIGKAELRDSYALLPFAQKEFAQKVEIEDFSILEKKNRYKKKNWELIRRRCKEDCATLYTAIEVFFETYGRHLTAASASMKTMMKIQGVKVENSGQDFFETMKKYYFGGRCECLKAGEYHEKLTYLDINSAYPFAMLHPHPFGVTYKTRYGREIKQIKERNFYTVIARSKGAFCRREKQGLVFDWDEQPRKYHVTGWELQAALETKKAKILQYVEETEFDDEISFEAFISHFWELRKKTKKGTLENTFAKLMMNSCYGKFAANPDNYQQFIFTNGSMLQLMTGAGWDICAEIDGQVLMGRDLEPEDMRFYNVATAASITGFVRSLLLRALAGVKNPIYCDTDSIIFTGKHNLSLSGMLGDWKLEGEFNEGYFAGKKLYAVKGKKGKPKIATKGSRLTFAQVKKITRGETIIYKQDAPNFSWKNENTRFLSRKIKKTS